MAPKKGSRPHNKKDVDLKLMLKLYYEKLWDFKRIADYFGLKSKSGIYDRFKKLGFKARTNSDLKTGFKHSDKTKKKISIAGIGRKHTESTKEKMRLRFLGNKNPRWKGGKILNVHGYIMIRCPDHPRSTKLGKYVAEHVLVMEKHLGRYLKKGEIVHHINEKRDDNRLENLKLMTQSEHISWHNTNKN